MMDDDYWRPPTIPPCKLCGAMGVGHDINGPKCYRHWAEYVEKTRYRKPVAPIYENHDDQSDK